MREHLRPAGAAATALALSAGLLAGGLLAPPAKAVQAEADPVIRVGLAYGDSALPTANLLNSTGSGYFFGYYDSELEFRPITRTDEQAITMCAAGSAPGRYHLQLNTGFEDGETAALAADAYGGYVCYTDGGYWVRTGAYDSYDAALSMFPEETEPDTSGDGEGLTTDFLVVEDGKNTVTVTATDTGKVLFQFDGEGDGLLAVLPDGAGEPASTWFKGYKYYGGFQYRPSGGSALTVVNVLSLEDYVKGVITTEMSASWPSEALKAQAVCARNYAYRRLSSSTHASQGFDICNTVHCQAYTGMKEATDRSNAAVDATCGEYVWYDGEIVETNYYSSNGGGSEHSENVWTAVSPHLRGVEDPYEALVADRIPKYHWTVTYTKQELSDLMNRKGYTNSGNVSVRVSKISPTGNVIEVVLTDLDNGRTWTKRKEDVRTFFGLRSMRYTIAADGSVADSSSPLLINGRPADIDRLYAIDGRKKRAPVSADSAYILTAGGIARLGGGEVQNTTPSADVFTFNGTGWGHHVGMSQWGAHAMALEGYTYQDILKFYYTGIEIRQP